MSEQSDAAEHAAESAARSDAFDDELVGQPPAPVFVAVPAKNYTRRSVVDFLFGVVIVLILALVVIGRVDRSNDNRRQARDDIEAQEQRERIITTNELIIDCTLPGPHVPDAADPTTGHDCFDQGQASTAAAITAIVDQNGNGCPDSVEVLNLLDPAHPQSCGPAPTTTAPPAQSGSSAAAPTTTANRPPPTEPPRTTTTVHQPNRRRR